MRLPSFDTVLRNPTRPPNPAGFSTQLRAQPASSHLGSRFEASGLRRSSLGSSLGSSFSSPEFDQVATEDFSKSTLPYAPSDGDGVNDGSFYIQAITDAKQPHIITNLLGEQSTIIWQSQAVWTLGRNREAAIPLRDCAMSRRHAVLVYLPQIGFQLVDLNSMNGVYVNGHRIQQRCLLLDGDRIRLGDTSFLFWIAHHQRTAEPLHPEVLSRYQGLQTHPRHFVDYIADDGDLVFNSLRRQE
jgi:hypothetical protein